MAGRAVSPRAARSAAALCSARNQSSQAPRPSPLRADRVITGALLVAARRIGQGESPLQPIPMEDARSPPGVAAWALVSTTFLIPATIVILVYPNLVAL